MTVKPYDSQRSVPALQYESAGKGFLVQEDRMTDDAEFKYLESNFGLAKSSWAEFDAEFRQLVASQDEKTRYKVLYLARHGQGYHNLAVDLYGRGTWYSELCRQWGNDKYTWGPDPELTELGEQQAKDNNTGWREQLSKGVPLPTVFYVSPMTRSINTMAYTWDGIDTKAVGKPLVVEDLREDLDDNTCNKRRPKSYLESRFGSLVQFEDCMTEQDELWSPEGNEHLKGHNVRTKRFLDHLFDTDWDSDSPHLYVSVTSHAGTIYSFLSSINHRDFRITPGGMIPVIVKATKP